MSVFKNRTIVILSPQPWNYLQISKHHYAKELAKIARVYYICSPSSSYYPRVLFKDGGDRVKLIEYSLTLPYFFRFKLTRLYKFFLKKKLNKIIERNVGEVDFVLDFGCYQDFDSMDFLNVPFKIFFPVDDVGKLNLDKRGADLVLTVSKNIQMKFPEGQCYFIHHGLAQEFSEGITEHKELILRSGKQISVGYAGNMFSRFIEPHDLERIILENPQILFHFFGSIQFEASIAWQLEWHRILSTSKNITMHGLLSSRELAAKYLEMDAFLLSYKPDNQYYHGENSHKIMEYLSTGKVVISSHISLYEDTQLMEMVTHVDNSLPDLFKRVINNLSFYNSKELMEKRMKYAFENTYAKNVLKISSWIEQIQRSQV